MRHKRPHHNFPLMNLCSRCSYSLEGLPEDHVCPECGLAYHGETLRLEFKSHSDSWKTIAITAASTSWIVLVPAFRAQPYWKPFALVWLSAVIFRIAALMYRSMPENQGEFIVDRTGIRMHRPKLGSRFIAISIIKRAHYSIWTGRLVLFGQENQKLLSIRYWELGGQANSKKCARRISNLVDEQPPCVGSAGLNDSSPN